MKTQNRTLIEIECNHCKKPFRKAASEIKRNNKLNRKSYCSTSCHISHRNTIQKLPTDHLNKGYVRTDEYSNFKYTYRNAKRRNKEFNLSLADLKDQWEFQKSICPYSGLQLVLPKGTHHKVPFQIRASLDRIDSTKGYVKGNIQFVSTLINFMKSQLTHKETIDFCLQIAKNYCSSYLED